MGQTSHGRSGVSEYGALTRKYAIIVPTVHISYGATFYAFSNPYAALLMGNEKQREGTIPNCKNDPVSTRPYWRRGVFGYLNLALRYRIRKLVVALLTALI